MSARGARSRKAVAKDIEKKEKKATQKAVEPIRRPHDAFAGWRPAPSVGARDSGMPSRQLTISSDASRGTSRTSSTNGSGSRPGLNIVSSHESSEYRAIHRSRTSLSGSASISDSSSKGKEKARYAAKGKETKAPRGRGGGVPVKRSATTPAPPLFRAETSLSYTPTNQKTWINFRIWDGGEKTLKPYGGFDFDEHMQAGTVLIYFKEEQVNDERPIPQIRAELDVLENSGSTWLSNALLYGRIDDDGDDWSLPDGSESSAQSPNFPAPPARRMLAPTSGGKSPPPFDIDQTYYGVPSNRSASRAQSFPDLDRPRAQTPPPLFQQTDPQKPTHELWFTAPAHLKSPQAQRLHHVAVRNFLAMLHNKPIVGADMFAMLTTLQSELQVMYDLDDDDHTRVSSRERSVQMITNYLIRHKLDDVRISIKVALSLLAWAEQDNVKWRQGYLECFVHLAGILNSHIEELPEFQRLSIVTRRNLGIAAKSLELKIMDAEEFLANFDFGVIWEDSAKMANSAIYQSYQVFRQFLINHYTRIYGNWPPERGKSWLNRKIVLDLQEDFGALYDYLVDREVVWDPREERPGKKWEMMNRRTSDFKADLPGLPLTDMLVTFDSAHGFLHIPHAYPLLPREVPQAKAPQKKSLFGGLKKSKADSNKDATKTHLQLSIIYSDATNMGKLESSFKGSTLIDQFEKFELGADLKNTSAREARLGRWILLYGVLQVLSKLSVDVQSLKFTDGVRYFLCTDLKRCPEWVTNGQIEQLEAIQQRSFCWQRSWDPTILPGQPVELDGNSMAMGGELGTTTPDRNDHDRNGYDRNLDGDTMLQNDIQRISEKIDNMGISRTESRLAAQREIEIRRENEKVMQEEFGNKRMDSTYRLTESDYQRPIIPSRSPLRSPPGSSPQTPSYPGSPNVVPVNTPNGHGYPTSPQAYSVQHHHQQQQQQQGNGYFGEKEGGWM
ncbi:hypothetical protein K458DRAFT_381481 [Lentithecium fluviatile CBS 122367]|uniref:DUF8004 domain-containing protein n=1 Tax=Lentithecium fluviatile CBS 122367 TaxID=1168545 RepID=A0A6G1JMC0_9PLEO|nr:hypothetical protein K458DRAFT_381481 [Lentithecium fluviatile CBS 122367]